MSTTESTETTPLLFPYNLINADAELAAADIAKNWGWIMAAGIINLIAGVFAIMSPTTATALLLLFASFTLVIAGAATMSGVCFAEAGMKSQSFVLGLAEIIVGLILWKYPFSSLMFATLMIAVVYMVNGAYLCGMAVQNWDSPNSGWNLISGFCGILFSILVMSAYPMSSLYTIGIIVGVNLINIGIARFAIANKGRMLAAENAQIEAAPATAAAV